MKTPFEVYGPIIIGVPSFIWFAFETNWKAAVAFYLCLLANNMSQATVCEHEQSSHG